MSHRVFSYGTLQQREVQLAIYGREVPTTDDSLPGYRLEWIQITDPLVVAASGSNRHPILCKSNASEEVPGVCLELNDEELRATDVYEVDDYARVEVVLASGATAWAYVAKT